MHVAARKFLRVALAWLIFAAPVIAPAPSFAQSPPAKLILFSQSQNNCPTSVLAAPNTPCPKVDWNPATGQAWVQGQGFVPLSSLAAITNATGGYVTNWDGSLTWKFGPVTNSIRNSTMQGAAAGSPGTFPTNWVKQNATSATSNVIATGIDPTTGYNYVDIQWIGTPTGGGFAIKFEGAQQIAATLGQREISSAYIAIVGGSIANITINVGFDENNAAGSFLAANTGAGIHTSLTATLQRFSTAAATSNASVAFVQPNIIGTISAGQPVNITLRIAAPQMELASYATQATAAPFVPTTNAAASSLAQLRVGTGTGLLVEESRTNLALQSNNFSNLSIFNTGTAVGTKTANAGVAPDGTSTANQLACSSGTGICQFYNNFTTSSVIGDQFTFSAYTSNASLQVGTTGATQAGCGSVTTIPVGTYFRQSIVCTMSANNGVLGYAVNNISPGTSALAWGIQLEKSGSPHSYCPTAAASVTCAGDDVTAAGVLLTTLQGASASIVAAIAAIPDQRFDKNIFGRGSLGYEFFSANTATGIYSYNGTTFLNAVSPTSILTNASKLGTAFSASGTSLVANNGTVVSNASLFPARTTVRFGETFFNSYFTRLSVWNSRLPDATLQKITDPLYSPTLVTDFANGLYTYNGYNIGTAGLALLFSVSNSAGYCTDGSGNLVGHGANAFPICPGTGLLPEDTRTNSIRTSDMTGAVLGVIGSGGVLPNNWTRDVDGGLTYTIAGKGASDIGEPYIDIRINGTSTGTFTNILFESSTGIAAANGQTWSLSAYLKLVAGSTANLSSYTLGIFERGAGGSYLAQSNSGSLLPATTSRQFVTRVFNNASTQFTNGGFGLGYNVGAAIDVTFRIGLPQQEQGAFPTSPILTTAASVTRNFDNIQALGPVLNLLGVSGAGSLMAAWTQSQYYASGAGASRQYIANWVDSGNTRWSLRSSDVSVGLAPSFAVGDGSTFTNCPTSATSYAAGTAMRMALRWNTASADQACSTNNAVAATNARQFGGTIGAPWYLGGNGASGNGLNTPLGVMKFYPGGLSNTSLQAAQ